MCVLESEVLVECVYLSLRCLSNVCTWVWGAFQMCVLESEVLVECVVESEVLVKCAYLSLRCWSEQVTAVCMRVQKPLHAYKILVFIFIVGTCMSQPSRQIMYTRLWHTCTHISGSVSSEAFANMKTVSAFSMQDKVWARVYNLIRMRMKVLC